MDLVSPHPKIKKNVRKHEPARVSMVLAFNRIEVTRIYSSLVAVFEVYRFGLITLQRVLVTHRRALDCRINLLDIHKS
jgi:hypothetical protein